MKKYPNLKQSYLDGEKLFRKYYEMGDAKSVYTLARWAISQGMAKPINKTPKNPEGLPAMGVWKSMWRWTTLKENRETAWNIFSEHCVMDYDKFLETVKAKIGTAWQHPTEAKKNKFMKENGWT